MGYLLFSFFNVYLFLRERGWARVGEGQRQRERERERERDTERGRIPRGLHAVSTEPDAGLQLTNCEIVT